MLTFLAYLPYDFLKPAADRFSSWLSEAESNLEAVEADAERLRIKYGDKDVPQEELKKYKVIEYNSLDLFKSDMCRSNLNVL